MVSEKAKVSKTTVSRFLNGKFEFMSVETKNRIQAVIDELEYRPNTMAQGLKNNKTGLIGLVVDDMTQLATAKLIKGVNDGCIKNDFQLMMVAVGNAPEVAREQVQLLIDRQVEGIIFNTENVDELFIKELKSQGIKLVLADMRLEDATDVVIIDHEKSMVELIKKVYDDGFEKMGFFSQPFSHKSSTIKHNIFIEGSKNFVRNAHELTYFTHDQRFGFEAYRKALDTFIKDNVDYKLVIFAENSAVMLNLVNGIYRLGLRIPEDIGVCGYDELGLKDLVAGGITTIEAPFYEVGFQATELLLKRIAKGKDQYKPRQVVLQTEVKIRNSTQTNESGFDKIVRSVNEENEIIVKNLRKNIDI